jgi:hypothetical protein
MDDSTFFMLIVGWFTCSILVGVFSSKYRGRSGLGHAVLAFFISPLLAFLIAAVSSKNEGKMAIEQGSAMSPLCGMDS